MTTLSTQSMLSTGAIPMASPMARSVRVTNEEYLDFTSPDSLVTKTVLGPDVVAFSRRIPPIHSLSYMMKYYNDDAIQSLFRSVVPDFSSKYRDVMTWRDKWQEILMSPLLPLYSSDLSSPIDSLLMLNDILRSNRRIGIGTISPSTANLPPLTLATPTSTKSRPMMVYSAAGEPRAIATDGSFIIPSMNYRASGGPVPTNVYRIDNRISRGGEGGSTTLIRVKDLTRLPQFPAQTIDRFARHSRTRTETIYPSVIRESMRVRGTGLIKVPQTITTVRKFAFMDKSPDARPPQTWLQSTKRYEEAVLSDGTIVRIEPPVKPIGPTRIFADDTHLVRHSVVFSGPYLDPSIGKQGDVFNVTSDGSLFMKDASGTWQLYRGLMFNGSTLNPAVGSPGDLFHLTSDGTFYMKNRQGRWELFGVSVERRISPTTTTTTTTESGPVNYPPYTIPQPSPSPPLPSMTGMFPPSSSYAFTTVPPSSMPISFPTFPYSSTTALTPTGPTPIGPSYVSGMNVTPISPTLPTLPAMVIGGRRMGTFNTPTIPGPRVSWKPEPILSGSPNTIADFLRTNASLITQMLENPVFNKRYHAIYDFLSTPTLSSVSVNDDPGALLSEFAAGLSEWQILRASRISPDAAVMACSIAKTAIERFWKGDEKFDRRDISDDHLAQAAMEADTFLLLSLANDFKKNLGFSDHACYVRKTHIYENDGSSSLPSRRPRFSLLFRESFDGVPFFSKPGGFVRNDSVRPSDQQSAINLQTVSVYDVPWEFDVSQSPDNNVLLIRNKEPAYRVSIITQRQTWERKAPTIFIIVGRRPDVSFDLIDLENIITNELKTQLGWTLDTFRLFQNVEDLNLYFVTNHTIDPKTGLLIRADVDQTNTSTLEEKINASPAAGSGTTPTTITEKLQLIRRLLGEVAREAGSAVVGPSIQALSNLASGYLGKSNVIINITPTNMCVGLTHIERRLFWIMVTWLRAVCFDVDTNIYEFIWRDVAFQSTALLKRVIAHFAIHVLDYLGARKLREMAIARTMYNYLMAGGLLVWQRLQRSPATTTTTTISTIPLIDNWWIQYSRGIDEECYAIDCVPKSSSITTTGPSVFFTPLTAAPGSRRGRDISDRAIIDAANIVLSRIGAGETRAEEKYTREITPYRPLDEIILNAYGCQACRLPIYTEDTDILSRLLNNAARDSVITRHDGTAFRTSVIEKWITQIINITNTKGDEVREFIGNIVAVMLNYVKMSSVLGFLPEAHQPIEVFYTSNNNNTTTTGASAPAPAPAPTTTVGRYDNIESYQALIRGQKLDSSGMTFIREDFTIRPTVLPIILSTTTINMDRPPIENLASSTLSLLVGEYPFSTMSESKTSSSPIVVGTVTGRSTDTATLVDIMARSPSNYPKAVRGIYLPSLCNNRDAPSAYGFGTSDAGQNRSVLEITLRLLETENAPPVLLSEGSGYSSTSLETEALYMLDLNLQQSARSTEGGAGVDPNTLTHRQALVSQRQAMIQVLWLLISVISRSRPKRVAPASEAGAGGAGGASDVWLYETLETDEIRHLFARTLSNNNWIYLQNLTLMVYVNTLANRTPFNWAMNAWLGALNRSWAATTPTNEYLNVISNYADTRGWNDTSSLTLYATIRNLMSSFGVPGGEIIKSASASGNIPIRSAIIDIVIGLKGNIQELLHRVVRPIIIERLTNLLTVRSFDGTLFIAVCRFIIRYLSIVSSSAITHETYFHIVGLVSFYTQLANNPSRHKPTSALWDIIIQSLAQAHGIDLFSPTEISPSILLEEVAKDFAASLTQSMFMLQRASLEQATILWFTDWSTTLGTLGGTSTRPPPTAPVVSSS